MALSATPWSEVKAKRQARDRERARVRRQRERERRALLESDALEELPLSPRTWMALRRAGLSLKDVLAATNADLLAVPMFGKRALVDLDAALAAFGLSRPPIRAHYSMDSIAAALHELEAAMKADPLCTIWALPGILEREDAA